MSAQPAPLIDQGSSTYPDAEPRLTRDEGWDLIESLFGSAKEMYAEVGGAEAWFAAERASWGE